MLPVCVFSNTGIIILVISHRNTTALNKKKKNGGLATLTPSNKRQLDQVVLIVGVEHLYQQKIQVKCLDSHPGEAAQQGVVHESCNKHTHPVWLHCGSPLSQQEGYIEQKQGAAQRHMYGKGVIHSVVSGGRDRKRTVGTCEKSIDIHNKGRF